MSVKRGFGCFFAILLFSPLALAGELSAIGVERTGLRPRPSILAKPTSFLKYGDQVSVGEKKGRWSKISLGNKSGWVESSSVGDRKSILKDLGKGEFAAKEAYKDEVASAGKGFSAEFEKLSKEKNPKLNFKDVDRLEKMIAPARQIVKFSKNGQLQSQVLKGEQ